MQPHEERVVAEKAELESKMEKLKVFFSGSIFHGLAEEDQSLLQSQYAVMKQYQEILEKRVNRFN